MSLQEFLRLDQFALKQSPHRVDGVKQPGVLHKEDGPLIAEGESRADGDAFVFFGDADQSQRRVPRDWQEDALTGGDVRQGNHEFDTAQFDGLDYG